ncbi:MAG: hydrogenase maturation protease [Candidatus Bipolaricaulota bacterium]
MERSFGASTAEVAVVGMGNPYCTDDGVGVEVVRSLPSAAGYEVCEATEAGAYLAQKLVGYSRVLLVDAAPALPPGEIRLAPLEEWEALGGERRGAHGMSLTRALEMLRALTGDDHTAHKVRRHLPTSGSVGPCARRPERGEELRVPEVWALAIGIPPDPPFGEGLSPRVAAAVPAAVEEVRGWLTR